MNLTKRLYQFPLSLYLVILGMWILFLHEVIKSFGVIEMYVAYSGFFILFIALLIELKNNALSFLNGKYYIWIISIWFFSVFALIYGGIAKLHSLQFLSRDIWPYSYFACLLLAARTNRWVVIDKMIYYQFLIGIGVFLYIGFSQDIIFERLMIGRNTLSWGEPRIYWAWGLLYGWQYMFLSFKKELPMHRKIVTILGIILFMSFGIIMLKRQPFVEFGAIFIIKSLFILNIETSMKSIKIILLNFFIVLIIIVLSIKLVENYEKKEQFSYMEALVSRSMQAGSPLNTILEDDRLSNTPLLIYNNANSLEVIWGQGLGSSVVRATGGNNTAVESGFFTVFMKGGVIFIIIWYFGFLNILWDTFFRKKKQNDIFGILSAVFIIFSPVFPFFISYPASGYQMFWLGRSVSRGRVSRAMV